MKQKYALLGWFGLHHICEIGEYKMNERTNECSLSPAIIICALVCVMCELTSSDLFNKP